MQGALHTSSTWFVLVAICYKSMLDPSPHHGDSDNWDKQHIYSKKAYKTQGKVCTLRVPQVGHKKGSEKDKETRGRSGDISSPPITGTGV